MDEIAGKLDDLSRPQIRKIRDYESDHENRKSLMEQLDRHLK